MANHFFSLLLFTATIFISIHHYHCRYLRPSDHGLAYQNTSNYPPRKDVPQMLSFFKGGRAATSLVPNPPLPEARNLSSSRNNNDDPAVMWWSKKRKSREGTGRDHVRKILLLTSLLCGLTGIVLLVVSAFVFIYRYRNRDQQLVEAERGKQRSVPVSTAVVIASHAGVKMKNAKPSRGNN